MTLRNLYTDLATFDTEVTPLRWFRDEGKLIMVVVVAQWLRLGITGTVR